MAPSEASETAHEIVDIFNEIRANKLNYCALCLRTEKERKLVISSSFMKCLCVMRLQIPVVNTICYMCDAATTRTVQLLQAINFSVTVNRWFKNITKKVDTPSAFEQYMQSYHMRGASPLPLLPLPAAWAAARRPRAFVQTDVLLVGHAKPNEEDGTIVEVQTLNPSTQTEAVDPLSTLSDPEIESIVIIEDDDPAPQAAPAPEQPEALPRLVPLENVLDNEGVAAVVPNEMQVITRHKDGSSFILHPIIVGSDGDFYVPSMNAKIQDGQIIFAPTVPGVVATAPAAPEGVVGAPATATTPGTVGRSPGLCEAVSKTRNRQRKKKAPPDVSEGTLICSDPLGDVTDGVPDVPAGSPAPEARAARPLQSGRIDWEDKIPMDVISFVDATDPYAEQLLQPPAPSAPSASPPRTRAPHKRRRGARDKHVVDLIDLC